MKKNSNYPEKERRKFIRIKKSGRIKFQKINPEKLEDTNIKKAKDGLYKNISPHGLMFESSEKFEKGDVLKLYLYLKDWMDHFPEEKELLTIEFKGKPIKLIGNVVYCEEIDNRKYQIGVEFFEIDQQISKKLMQIIKQELS